MFFNSAQLSEYSRGGVSSLGLFPPQEPFNFCAVGLFGGAADVSWLLGGGAEMPDPRLPGFFLRLFLSWTGDGRAGLRVASLGPLLPVPDRLA